MNFPQSVIRAYAQQYTRAELVEMRAAALQELTTSAGSVTSASTGGGASYSQQLHMSAVDRVDLLQQVIDYVDSVANQTDIAQFATPVIALLRR